jgi:hypothetical protein
MDVLALARLHQQIRQVLIGLQGKQKPKEKGSE